MPIVIETRYIAATDKRVARVKASENGRSRSSLTVSFDYTGREHEKAARRFRDTFYPGEPLLFCGSTRDGRGDIYCIGAVAVKEGANHA